MINDEIINSEKIKEFLAHRYPFLLIDRVVSYEPMKFVHAIKCVSVNEPQFQGHFPQRAIYPGVMIIESMAQATGILGALSLGKEDDSLYYLASVDKCRFRGLIVPGDVLNLHVEAIGQPRRKMWRFSCVAKVDDKCVAEAKLLCTNPSK